MLNFSFKQIWVLVFVHILLALVTGSTIPNQHLNKEMEQSDYSDYYGLADLSQLVIETVEKNNTHPISHSLKNRADEPQLSQRTTNISVVLNAQNGSEAEVPILITPDVLNLTTTLEESRLEDILLKNLGPRPRPHPPNRGSEDEEIEIRSRSMYWDGRSSESFFIPGLVSSMYSTAEDLVRLRASFRKDLVILTSYLYKVDHRITTLIKGKVKILEEADGSTLTRIGEVMSQTDEKLQSVKEDYGRQFSQVHYYRQEAQELATKLDQVVSKNKRDSERKFAKLSNDYKQLRQDSQKDHAYIFNLIKKLEEIPRVLVPSMYPEDCIHPCPVEIQVGEPGVEESVFPRN